MRDEKFPMGKIPDRRTELTYKAVIGGRLCTTRRSPKNDVHDVMLLCETFQIAIPDEYKEK